MTCASPSEPAFPVPAADVRAQLARILDSPSFLKAPILSRFLRHVVEQTLAGATDALKEYSLGVDVFDRGDSFDPRTDTIVRVQARRLRFRLRDYYGAIGQSDSIRIEVPTGGYVALFQRQTGERGFTSDSGGRLPVPRTPLVGRTRELEEVTELVMDPDVRLLTLSGAGGSGKTRLALEAARGVTDEFAGGVLMLPLAPLVDPTSVVTAVGQMLGLRQTGGRATADAVREHVARSIAAPTLLVLDNFEHVLAAAPIVADLLDASAHVKLLVTSRAVLRVYGEHDYPVPPLALPHPAAALGQLECNPAVRLFTQRAEAAQHGFALTAQNAACVAEICRRLDGLPLAIELAAARAKVLPVDGILARLPHSLDFLTGGARERPARQQTLRHTIDWSHRLLSPAEQGLFRRLAVFAGGWTLEGAEAVCNAHRDLEIDVEAGIASLVEKSLVQHAESFDGEARYRMLETLREYAFEQMRLLNEDGRTRRAHAAYCIVIAEEGNPQLLAAERGRWLARCDLEHDNFRAALDWVIATGNADWAFRLGLALYAFWERREHLVEGRQRLEAIVNLDGAEALADRWAHALSYIAALGGLGGDAATVRELHETSLATFRTLGNRKGEALALNALGSFFGFNGQYETARVYYEQAVTVCRAIGSQPEIAAALSNLAGVVSRCGDRDRAYALLEEAHTIFEKLGDQVAATWTVNHLGDVARRHADPGEARRLYQRAVERFGILGDLWGISRSSADLAYVTCDTGDYQAAHQLFAGALVALERLDHKRGIARVFDGFAYLAQREGQFDRALTLAAAAAAVRQAFGAVPRPADEAVMERSLHGAWNACDPATAHAVWSAGQQLTLDDAIALALERPASVTTRS